MFDSPVDLLHHTSHATACFGSNQAFSRLKVFELDFSICFQTGRLHFNTSSENNLWAFFTNSFEMDDLREHVISYLWAGFIVCSVCLFLWLSYRLLVGRQLKIGNEKLFTRQLIMLFLSLAGVVTVVLALPVSESVRSQIVGLIGLVISGIFAFSSSTIFANLMAGIMLRITRPFQTGDFIRLENMFGRVVERGLLDTEIQLEDRSLVAVPNLKMVKNAITVTRSRGTIISSTLSLGYDVHHSRIENLLLEAAEKTKLKEPFVQILQLGDFSITYKVSGQLEEVKTIFTARSNLNRCILDTLHANEVEIVSPAFMNQRRLSEGESVIPRRQVSRPSQGTTVDTEKVFDIAEKAKQNEEHKAALNQEMEDLTERLNEAAPEEKEQLQARQVQIKEALASLKKEMEEESEL